MHIVPPPPRTDSATPAPRALCPVCGQQASHGSPVRKGTDGALSVYYICPDEHLFGVRWAPTEGERD